MGEKRPEVFVPGLSGAIIPKVAYVSGGDAPSASSRGAAPQVVNNVTVESPPGYQGSVQQQGNGNGGMDIRVTFARMQSETVMSGGVDRAMAARFGLYPRTSGR